MDRQMTTTEILDMLRGQLERDKTYERELEIQKVEARKRIEKLESALAAARDKIKALESRPTLAQQGRMLEDLNMLQAKLNASEEQLRFLKAENEQLKDDLFKARDERDEYMTRSSAEEMLREEVEKKLEFWKGWGIVIGMMIANVIWLISKEIF